MPSNTTYDPNNTSYFDKTKLNKDAKGIAETVTAGQTKNIDFALTDDSLLAGGTVLLVKGAAQGDKIDFQVVHPVAGVLLTFVKDWYVNPDSTKQDVPTAPYPAKLFAGLILRLVYYSVGETDVWVAINYNKEKVLE
jgi:hypothetical protein